MTSGIRSHLPTEVLIIIIGFLFEDLSTNLGTSQTSLQQRDIYNFCLVSCHWYSVGISYLHDSPYIYLNGHSNELPIPDAGISRCRALEDLDLGGICGTGVDLRLIKRVVSNLVQLHSLILPYSLEIRHVDVITGYDWPSNLASMTYGDLLDPEAMLYFDWSTRLQNLSISHCVNLETRVLESVLGHPLQRLQLKGLKISAANDRLYTASYEETEVLRSM
ncbi:hypothetical protein PENSUB_11470 [Penicillium subrubescens]|uniref:F-box domain-containing protein n=1 Tax=Penicillium subrubescens TaxID=1316194 RepID=A0A1Q5UQG5_9EURO|nr:hypothetical protein PENSUB_11470 [Penicillium subrubescens]